MYVDGFAERFSQICADGTIDNSCEFRSQAGK